jgi:hypothetical protein
MDLKKSGIFEIWGPKKTRPKTVSRCRMATSGKSAKTRENESFTSEEVEAASCRFAEDAARCRIYGSADVSGIQNADRQ